jgi:hypothetical protein
MNIDMFVWPFIFIWGILIGYAIGYEHGMLIAERWIKNILDKR